eukprot:9436220-Pyramimonas_sp.AAC.1
MIFKRGRRRNPRKAEAPEEEARSRVGPSRSQSTVDIRNYAQVRGHGSDGGLAQMFSLMRARLYTGGRLGGRSRCAIPFRGGGARVRGHGSRVRAHSSGPLPRCALHVRGCAVYTVGCVTGPTLDIRMIVLGCCAGKKGSNSALSDLLPA